MNLCNNYCISLAVSIATDLFEAQDKYFDILTWNMIFFMQKSIFLFCMWVFHYLLKSVATENDGVFIDTKH